ncbi:MAG: OmpA family protein [Verrucomicrobiae bacterium]|nr:OmpA family protein [Verrucomicrobiae bacterium]
MNESENRAPLFVFTGIVVLSVLFFFLFTSGGDKKAPKGGGKPGLPTNADLKSPGGGVMPPDGQYSIPVDMGLNGRSDGSELPSSAKAAFAGAPEPVRAFAANALDGKLEASFNASAQPIPDAEQKLIAGLFDSGLWSLDEGREPVELGQFGEKFRWKLPFRDASSEKSSPALYLDLARGEGGRGWKLADVRIPPALVAPSIASLKAHGTNIAPSAIRTEVDSLMTAEQFMNAVAESEFERAISMADLDKVTREKIAGLFIIIEEGKYRLQESKPLMATVATSDAAWIIGRIESDAGMAASDFGVELARKPGSEWKVTGLHFSKLLASFAASASPDAVPYTPIVENPSGGESLVLYFGYDEDMLHLRAQRQLLIVATLMKDDATKKLRITGHADAMGTEDYNLALSARRAYSVRDSLIKLGVPADQIITQGFGESAPLAANVREDGSDNPEGRSKNRRTEIFLDF